MVLMGMKKEWVRGEGLGEYEMKKEERRGSLVRKDEMGVVMEGKVKKGKEEL